MTQKDVEKWAATLREKGEASEEWKPPRYWAADGILRTVSIAQCWFRAFCRSSRAFKVKQLGKVDFRATELIHHLSGSWKALYRGSEAFREDFRRFGLITAFHAFDAVPFWQLRNCFDFIFEALTLGGLLLVRFNLAADGFD